MLLSILPVSITFSTVDQSATIQVSEELGCPPLPPATHDQIVIDSELDFNQKVTVVTFQWQFPWFSIFLISIYI